MNKREKEREFRLQTGFYFEDDFDDEYFEGDEGQEPCHFCDGNGCGIIGVDWDSDDYINGPYDGEIADCPCCGGSGLEKDAIFWQSK